ncbi:MAG: TonB-dependent receptor [Halioglobus sp.]|nr:TonB-dependent receptor [Halioglobus sp.]
MVCLCATGAAASSAAIEDVLVTGTFSPQPALTASVSVLNAEQITALNKTNVADLLKTLPGLLVEEQGGPGGLTAVSIRGGEANFTLVLVDGVEVNDPTNTRGGGFDFANLDPNLVDRIEVVRGAQSAVYGSDAVAGVINVITRRAGQGHQQAVSAEWGEDDYADYNASALGRFGAFDYTVELAHRDDGEPVEGSKRKTDSANVRLGWRVTDAQELTLGYRYVDGDRRSYPEQSGGPELAVNKDLDKSDYTQEILSLTWGLDISSAWRSLVKASRFHAQEDFVSPGISPYLEVPPNASDTDFTRDYVNWTHTLIPLPALTVSVGADYRHEDGKSTGYLEFAGNRLPTDFELDRNTAGVFTGITSRPMDAMLLQAAVRYDNPEGFDSETSWHVGAQLSPIADVMLAANWGESYKLPSFFALGQALVGNPDLVPEQGESWDVGAVWQLASTIRLGVTWFDNDYRDLVDFDDATFRNVNRSNVQTRGVELQADWQPLDAVSIRTQGTYTDIDVKREDTRLTGRPQWVASMVLQWQVAPDWLTTLDYQFSGEQWSASRYTGEELTVELDSFHEVDWVLRWQVAKAWQLQISLDNALDEDYETAVGFPAPGREFRLGVKFVN